MNLERLRAETPGCSGRVHLNNAGAALMPDPVLAAVRDHLDLEAGIGGYEAEAARQEAIGAAYEAVAALLGTKPRNIAFTESATASYVQALSAIPFRRGDRILTTRHDYASSHIQFLSLKARIGVEIEVAPDAPEGGVDVGALAARIRSRRPRLVAATQVPTSSGVVQDVEAIGRICREEDVPYLVDACQSVGQMPVDVQEIGCDFLAATSRKFLRGPRGAGFLYVSDRALEAGLEPLFIDMHGAEWRSPDRYERVGNAQRFETFEFAWALVLGTSAAARYALETGLDRIRDRARALAARLREGLAALDGVRVLDRGRVLGAIVTAWVDGWEPADLVAALRERRINTSAQSRGYNVLDFDAKGVAGALRLSPHYYNTEEEIDVAVAAVGELAASRR